MGGRAAGTTSYDICVATSPPEVTPAAKPPMAVSMLIPSLWRGGSCFVSLWSLEYSGSRGTPLLVELYYLQNTNWSRIYIEMDVSGI